MLSPECCIENYDDSLAPTETSVIVIPLELNDRQIPYAVPIDSWDEINNGMDAMNGI